MQLCSAALAACVTTLVVSAASGQALDVRTVPVEASAGLAIQRTAASLLEEPAAARPSGLDLASLATTSERKVSVIAPDAGMHQAAGAMGSNSWDMGSAVPSWGGRPHVEAAASRDADGGRSMLLFGGGSVGALAFVSVGWFVIRRGPSTGESR